MQKGSLVTPSERFLRETAFIMEKFPEMIFIPKIPEKEDIFVCESDIYINGGKKCIAVDGLKAMYIGQDVHFNIYLWNEIQPPMDLTELMKEAVSGVVTT